MAVEQSEKKAQNGFLLSQYRYQSSEEALQMYKQFSPEMQEEMGITYQDGFAGSPWKEACKCPNCNKFMPSNLCTQCGATDLSEAYPLAELTGKYFPKMVSKYSPGVLILAKDQGKIIGFSTGGFTNFGDLLTDKYNDEYADRKRVGNSINIQAGLMENDYVWYDDETTVRQSYQTKKTGTQLNEDRIDAAIKLGATVFCGRSVNEKWLGVKEMQFATRGFQMNKFIPDGDSYQIEGKPRYFYVASKIIN